MKNYTINLNKITLEIESISKKYADIKGINRDKDWFLLKLQEELGELVQCYLRSTGRKKIGERSEIEIRNDLEDETADLFCQVLLFAFHNNIDVIKAVEGKWFNSGRYE